MRAPRGKNWSKQEIAYLENYRQGKMSMEEIAAHLNRPIGGVRRVLEIFNIVKSIWTPPMDEFLKAHYNKENGKRYSARWCAEQLSEIYNLTITPRQVFNRRYVLGLKY